MGVSINGVPLNHLFIDGLSLINGAFYGVPPFMKTSIWHIMVYPIFYPIFFFETQMIIELVEPNMTLRIVSWSETLVYGKVLDDLDS